MLGYQDQYSQSVSAAAGKNLAISPTTPSTFPGCTATADAPRYTTLIARANKTDAPKRRPLDGKPSSWGLHFTPEWMARPSDCLSPSKAAQHHQRSSMGARWERFWGPSTTCAHCTTVAFALSFAGSVPLSACACTLQRRSVVFGDGRVGKSREFRCCSGFICGYRMIWCLNLNWGNLMVSGWKLRECLVVVRWNRTFGALNSEKSVSGVYDWKSHIIWFLKPKSNRENTHIYKHSNTHIFSFRFSSSSTTEEILSHRKQFKNENIFYRTYIHFKEMHTFITNCCFCKLLEKKLFLSKILDL